MAKQLDAPYMPGKRKGMAKVKREREIDCVVLGWRPGKEEGTVGSLILGLYDGDDLRPVGHISGFSADAKRAMPAMLAPLETGESGTAEPSRWTGGRDLEWVALRPELVIEVGYDHAAAGRIRHGARFRRFRTDKDPQGVRLLAARRRMSARRGGPGRRVLSRRGPAIPAELEASLGVGRPTPPAAGDPYGRTRLAARDAADRSRRPGSLGELVRLRSGVGGGSCPRCCRGGRGWRGGAVSGRM